MEDSSRRKYSTSFSLSSFSLILASFSMSLVRAESPMIGHQPPRAKLLRSFRSKKLGLGLGFHLHPCPIPTPELSPRKQKRHRDLSPQDPNGAHSFLPPSKRRSKPSCRIPEASRGFSGVLFSITFVLAAIYSIWLPLSIPFTCLGVFHVVERRPSVGFSRPPGSCFRSGDGSAPLCTAYPAYRGSLPPD
jgi:hypothetical protein